VSYRRLAEALSRLLAVMTFGITGDVDARGESVSVTPPPASAEAGMLEALRDKCEGGDGRSCRRLAYRYSSGAGVARDPERATSLFSRACDLDDPVACVILADRYVGQAHQDDSAAALIARAQALFTKAAGLYKKACDQGKAEGCGGLGDAYIFGRGLSRDVPRGIKLLTSACDADDAASCDSLAVAFEEDLGPIADRRTALDRAAALREKAKRLRAKSGEGASE
jgi:TPR repeat protein